LNCVILQNFEFVPSTVSEITNSVFGRLVIVDFVGVSHEDVSTQLVK